MRYQARPSRPPRISLGGIRPHNPHYGDVWSNSTGVFIWNGTVWVRGVRGHVKGDRGR